MRSGGIFNKPGLGGVRHGGIFSLGAFGGVVEDQIAKCVSNRVSKPCAFSQSLRDDLIEDCIVASKFQKSPEACDPCKPISRPAAQAECEKFHRQAVDCAKDCEKHRQDSPEWANCIQDCHGYSTVDYGAQKVGCAAQGKIYSWLEGGCVSKEKYDSCPPNTVYATYEDGSEKCIGISTDLTTAKCPAGTSLKTVPGGQACVSPVKPGVKQPPPGPTPTGPGTEVITGTKTGTEESKAGFPIWMALLAVAAAGGLYWYSQREDDDNVPKLTPNRGRY
jgi:hypothetical protein